MNRLNLQSADPRKLQGRGGNLNNKGPGNLKFSGYFDLRNASAGEGNTDEYVSAELNTASNLNQMGHDQVKLETQSRDEIFQVNNLIKNSQIQVDDKKMDSRSVKLNGRNVQGSEVQLKTFMHPDDAQFFRQYQQTEKNSISTRSNKRRSD